MERRQFLKGLGMTGTAVLIAGCGSNSGDENEPTDDSDTEDNPVDDSDTKDSPADDSDGETHTTSESSGTAYVDGKIKFLMSPSEPQDRLRDQYTPIRERLNSFVNTVDTVDLQYANNYAATLTALDAGTGDIAETGPFAGALGVFSGNAEVLLQRKGYGSWTYSSVIVTRPETDIGDLTDLEGKTVAFADALSASGSLYPLGMIQEAGLSVPDEPGSPAGADFTPQWATHQQAYEALTSGTVDAAGVGYFIVADDEREGVVDEVEAVARDDGIPRAPIMVSPQLSDEEKMTIQEAFTEASEDIYLGADGEDGTEDDLWFTDVRPADAGTYQPVVEKAESLGYGADVFES
ncbi:MAG: substrate-binding domain-containing protein [Halovenus sp.]